MIHKIFYNKRVTQANTTYLEIIPEDIQFIISKCIQITAYMGELSLTKEKEVKEIFDSIVNDIERR